MPYVLDSFSHWLYQKVVEERRIWGDAGPGTGWRTAAPEAVAMSGMQFATRVSACCIQLLVRERVGTKARGWTIASFVWANMRSTKDFSKAMSSPLRLDVPCWPLSPVCTYGTTSEMLLRERDVFEAMFGHKLQFWMELRSDVW